MLASIIRVQGSPFSLCHQSNVSWSDRTEPEREEGRTWRDRWGQRDAKVPRQQQRRSLKEWRKSRGGINPQSADVLGCFMMEQQCCRVNGKCSKKEKISSFFSFYFFFLKHALLMSGIRRPVKRQQLTQAQVTTEKHLWMHQYMQSHWTWVNRVKLRVKECVSFRTQHVSLPLPSFKSSRFNWFVWLVSKVRNIMRICYQ